MIWLWWITVPTSCKVGCSDFVCRTKREEGESDSGPLSRSYGLGMIGFSIPYQGVVHDESSLHFKSTPIKEGLCIPLWHTFVDVRLEQTFSPPFSFNKQCWHSQGLAKPECVLLPPRAPAFVFVVADSRYLLCHTWTRAHSQPRHTVFTVQHCTVCASRVVSARHAIPKVWSPVPEPVNSFAFIPLLVSPQSPF